MNKMRGYSFPTLLSVMDVNHIKTMEIVKFKLIFYFYFLNVDISLDMLLASTNFLTFIEHILMQGNVSQNYCLGLSFYFMTTNG